MTTDYTSRITEAAHAAQQTDPNRHRRVGALRIEELVYMDQNRHDLMTHLIREPVNLPASSTLNDADSHLLNIGHNRQDTPRTFFEVRRRTDGTTMLCPLPPDLR